MHTFVFWHRRERCRLLPASWQLCHGPQRRNHHPAGPSPRYVPRRAVLYCPGNDERKLRKLATLDVDCAVLDCEDGVALSKKVEKCLECNGMGSSAVPRWRRSTQWSISEGESVLQLVVEPCKPIIICTPLTNPKFLWKMVSNITNRIF